MMPKILFILKRREDFDPTKHTSTGMQTGLYNSASFTQNMLLSEGVDSALDIAIDANDIDRIVTKHNPTHVIIEALWVVPSKFTELRKLHPSVKWIVRLHSETPFLSQEGIAFDWIGDYAVMPNVYIAANSPRMAQDITIFTKSYLNANNTNVIVLPNYYPHTYKHPKIFNETSTVLNVGCFGAVRPLKNHTLQAIAALNVATDLHKQLHFHINARVETKGDAVLNNLKSIFQHTAESGHQLIFHDWKPRAEFLDVCRSMDVGMQVSLSETFNIVAADLVSQGVPTIGSFEIPWMCEPYQAESTDVHSISYALRCALAHVEHNIANHQQNLSKYSDDTRTTWIKYFSGE